MVASSSNENACPGNGAYDFSVNYTLPKAGNFSWLASGWAGEGLIQMFAEVDETMKIGECGLGLETYVTRKESNTSILEFPSAAVSSGLFLALFAVFMIICCYCYVCRRGRAISTEKPADEISYFSKMEDDAKSTRSRASSKKTKKTDASVVSDLI